MQNVPNVQDAQNMKSTAIKICGLVSEEDVAIVNKLPIDYAGFVLFYPKSKRNLTVEMAAGLIRRLKPSIKPVAVTVSPTLQQVKEIEKTGFAVLQVHNTLDKEVEKYTTLPIFRAVNVEKEKDVWTAFLEASEKIQYLVFDGKNPGSGKSFDWGFLKESVDNTSRIMLAGGLHEGNVKEAINLVHPGIVDVSSGVENAQGHGKDKGKVERFVRAVMNAC